MDKTVQAIRSHLKANGYNARRVTVKSSQRTHSRAYDLVVRDDGVSLQKIKNLVSQFESIDHDEVTGEILGGGNTFVSVYRHRQNALEVPREFVALCESLMMLKKGMAMTWDEYVLFHSDDNVIEIMSNGATVPFKDQIGVQRVWLDVHTKQRAVEQLWRIVSEHELDLAQCE